MANKAETEVVQEAQAPQPAPEPQAQGAELTVNDLSNIKQIIDVASSMVHLSLTK